MTNGKMNERVVRCVFGSTATAEFRWFDNSENFKNVYVEFTAPSEAHLWRLHDGTLTQEWWLSGFEYAMVNAGPSPEVKEAHRALSEFLESRLKSTLQHFERSQSDF